MKKSISTLFELLLFCAVLSFAVALLRDKRPDTGVPVEPGAATLERHADQDTAGTPGITGGIDEFPYLEPSRIALLFGWRPPAVHAPPAPEPIHEPEQTTAPATPVPEPADWLVFVGRVKDGDGTRYFFRNARSGRIEKAVQGEGGDWKLLEAAPGQLILEKNDQRYTAEVPR